jgi:hypothetical protein
MMTTSDRILALVAQAAALEPWVGRYDAEVLRAWLDDELGDALALDGWITRGPVKSKAVALSPVLHVVSGNTPHAAFQSVIRGLLLGGYQRVKLPSGGLPEFEDWLASLPGDLSCRIDARRDLPHEWLDSQAAVIFGDASTIEYFRRSLPPQVPRIEHGPKLSVAVVFEPSAEAAERLAEDVLAYDQRGCLSVQAAYVDATFAEIRQFGDTLEKAMAAHRAEHPRRQPTLSDSGSVMNFRETIRYRQANGDAVNLWESPQSTEWTILLDASPQLLPGPLNGTVVLHPLPPDWSRQSLGAELEHLSTMAIHPFTDECAARLDPIMPPRICALGMSQQPTLFWHHDGIKPLNTLVRWRDLG